MKNILQISNRIPWPPKDGGALGIYNYTKGFFQNGCDVTIASLNTKKHFVEIKSLPSVFTDVCKLHSVYKNTDVKLLPAFFNLFSSKSYNISRFISSEFENMLAQLLKENSYDVIIVESIFMAPYCDIIRKHSKAPLVLRAFNVEHRIWERLTINETNPVKRQYLKLLSRRLKNFESSVLNNFDAVLPYTNVDAEFFKKLGCTVPLYPLPVPVDIDNLQPDFSHYKEPSLFHLGSMDWFPNQEAVSWFCKEVMPDLSVDLPLVKFYAAGRNMPKDFFNLAGPNIEIVGEVDDSAEFIRSKSLMVVPLLSGSGIRVKILEGMALGKTIISTSVGAEGIGCTHNENILIADTPQQFIEMISHCFQNPERSLEIGKNARQFAMNNFSIVSVAAQSLNIFKNLKSK